MLYLFMDENGNFYNLENTSPYQPVILVKPNKDTLPKLQCFLSASDADYYRHEMRNRFLEFADDFDNLLLTWRTNAWFEAAGYEPCILQN